MLFSVAGVEPFTGTSLRRGRWRILDLPSGVISMIPPGKAWHRLSCCFDEENLGTKDLVVDTQSYGLDGMGLEKIRRC